MNLLPKVFKTEGDMVEFDLSKIFLSLMKETSMNEKDANYITELAARRIISSGIEFLSGPHIREIVCSVLSEQHFEQERKFYTRIGMPLMDYEEILEKGPKDKPDSRKLINPEKIHHWAANQLAEEYTLLRVLDNEESKAHLYGDIHIHKLKYFDLRPLSQIWDPRIILKNGLPPTGNLGYCCKSGPARNINIAVNHLTKWLGMTQAEFCGIQGYDFITTYLAPYAKGLNDDELKIAMRNLIFEINQLSSVIGRDIPVTSISCSPTIINELFETPAVCPKGVISGTYGEYNKECLKIFNIINEIFNEGDFFGNAFNSPKHIIYINEDWLKRFEIDYVKVWDEIFKMKTPYIFNLCSKRFQGEYGKVRSGHNYYNYGVLQIISLNLPRYAYLGKTENNFIEILRERINLCSNILNKKYAIIKKRLNSNHLPLCCGTVEDQPLFKLESQDLGISIIGLNEAVKFLTNYELHENNDSFNFGKSVVEKIKKICDEISKNYNRNFILFENYSEKTRRRFTMLDKKHFQGSVKHQINENDVHYSNSFHFRENIQMDIFDKITKLSEYHSILDGAIERISLDEIKNNKEILKKLVEKSCIDSEINCLTFDS